MREDQSTHPESGWLAAMLPFLIFMFPLFLLHRESEGIDRLARDAAHRA